MPKGIAELLDAVVGVDSSGSTALVFLLKEPELLSASFCAFDTCLNMNCGRHLQLVAISGVVYLDF